MPEKATTPSEPAAYGKVAVLMGGWSAEREISLQSGTAVLQALVRSGVDAVGIDVDRDILVRLSRESFDRAFVALHGRGGEDGTIQGALETLGLPYTGSGVLASALGMDKRRTKLVWAGAGIPTPPHVTVTRESDLDSVEERIGFPVMVKPAHEGSSIGMGRADDLPQLRQAWKRASEFDAEVIVERWINGPEFTVAILGSQPLPMIRLETPRGFYDYEAKYHDEGTQYICPCGLEAGQEGALQALGLRAFHEVGAAGWGRVDLICDERGQAWFLEVNTVPGMTGHSLVPMAAKAAGLDFDALVLRILDTAGAVTAGQPPARSAMG